MPELDAPRLWRWLGDAVPDALLLVDQAGRIHYANPHAHTVFGYAPGTLTGRPIEDLLPPEARAQHAAHRRRYAGAPTLREMGNRSMALRGMRADGRQFPAQIRLAPLPTGEEMLTTAIVRDVTEHERVTAELAAARAAADGANEVKSRFLGAVSHDLRQPLQSLAFLNGLLLREVRDADARLALEQQRRAIDVMSDLVNSVLNVSKLESGTIRPVVTHFAVGAVFDEVCEPLAQGAAAKGLRIETHAGAVAISTDRALFRQVLQNLVSNALRYTDAGSVRVAAAARDERTVTITVADTGIGIPASAIDTIFQDFVQIERPGDRIRGGVGLGLGTVRRIAELLGLKVSVTSTVGVGSSFTVDVPRAEAADVPRAVEADRTPAARRAAPRRVLFVDDDAAVRSAVVMYLEKVEGYAVTALASVDEVRGLLERQPDPPAIVVSDFHLGHGQFGTDAVALVRARFDPGIPVIMLTGDTSAIAESIASAPATALLNKPIDVAVLTALMAQMIKAAAR